MTLCWARRSLPGQHGTKIPPSTVQQFGRGWKGCHAALGSGSGAELVFSGGCAGTGSDGKQCWLAEKCECSVSPEIPGRPFRFLHTLSHGHCGLHQTLQSHLALATHQPHCVSPHWVSRWPRGGEPETTPPGRSWASDVAGVRQCQFLWM